jgi:hypothetical protein
MIDNVSILISTLMVMYLIWRAARLDRIRPWFESRAMYEKAQEQTGKVVVTKAPSARLFRR